MAKHLDKAKAKKMLKEIEAGTRKATEKQIRYFGFIAGGGKPKKK